MKRLKWIARGYLKALYFIGENFVWIVGSILIEVLAVSISGSWWGLLVVPVFALIVALIIVICYGVSSFNDWLQEWSKEDK